MPRFRAKLKCYHFDASLNGVASALGGNWDDHPPHQIDAGSESQWLIINLPHPGSQVTATYDFGPTQFAFDIDRLNAHEADVFYRPGANCLGDIDVEVELIMEGVADEPDANMPW